MPLKSASNLVHKQHEFKGHKCLSSNDHYFSTAYPFAEIFDSLDSQQSKEKIWSKNMVPYHSSNKAEFAKFKTFYLKLF